jgi:hypothetical protein
MEYVYPLFVQGRELVPTARPQSPPRNHPLNFGIAFHRRRGWGRLQWESCRDLQLALYDPAGQLYRREEALAYCGQVVIADGLIVLVAPESLPGLGRQLRLLHDEGPGGQGPADWRRVGVRETLETVTDAIAARAGPERGERLAKSAAFALSKADLLDYVAPAGMARWSELPEIDYDGPYGDGATTEVDGWVRALLGTLGDQWVVEASERFEPNRWFAVSATGQRATGGRFMEPIRPQRVVDPLVWLLWRLGEIADE